MVQTDTQLWTDINLLVSVSHSDCSQAVMLSHSVSLSALWLLCLAYSDTLLVLISYGGCHVEGGSSYQCHHHTSHFH